MTTQFLNTRPATNPIILPNDTINAANAAANNNIASNATANTSASCAIAATPPAPSGCGASIDVSA